MWFHHNAANMRDYSTRQCPRSTRSGYGSPTSLPSYPFKYRVWIYSANANTTKTLTHLQRWVHTEDARSACQYALLLVQEIVFSGKRYLARENNVLPRPWCLYFAVMTLWVYGQFTEGPALDGETSAGAEE
ncbi:hypothetical protein N7526_011444 [Penicillium atrosanguineum]|nr:hypothetical protein N7526_011444 [Penicillium atrosanguineum]